MPTTVISSIGTASRDYSTLQAWDDDCPADLVSADEIWRGEGYNDSEFTSGYAAGSVTQDATRYKELTTAAGQSFSDNASVRTNALRYNVSNGCGHRVNSNYSGAFGGVGLGKLSRWQIANDGTGGACAGPTVGPQEARDLICEARAGGGGAVGVGPQGLVVNVLAVAYGSGVGFTGGAAYGGGATVFIGCAAMRPTDVSSAGRTGFSSAGGSCVLTSCVSFGSATPASAGGWSGSSSYNATEASSGLPGSNNQHSVTYTAATPFEQASSGGALDFRAIAATDLDGNGFLDATNAPEDISNSTRPSSPTIGVWELSPASGGSTFNITPSGTITPAGVLVKDTSKPFTGTITPAGLLTKSLAKLWSGSVTPTGALALLRTLPNSFSGTLTSTGTLAKSISKTVTGTTTPAGALTLVKVVIQLFAGTITSAGTLTRSIGKTVTGVVTPAGALAKAMAVVLMGTVISAGTIFRVTAKLVVGSVTPEGALTTIRLALLDLAGTVTPAGTLVRAISKTVIGSIAATGSLAKSSTKAFAGSIAPSGTLDALRALFVTITGTVTPTGQLLRTMGATFTGILTPTGTLAKLSARSYAGTISATGSLAKLVSKFWSGTITFLGTLVGLSGAALIPSTIEVSGTYTPDVEVSGSYTPDIEVHGTFP